MKVDELRQKIEHLPDLTPNPKRFTWEFRQQDLRTKILKHNPEEFLTWPVIKETMFVGNAPRIPDIYKQVRNYIYGIGEYDFGLPELYNDNVSGNTIRNAYHLQSWELAAGQWLKNLNSIIEFGGGYGAMAVLCRQLGFDGKYIIVDLPEFSLLQEYYLSNTIGLDNIELHTSWDKKKFEADLLIACCSLSEVKWLEKRDTFLAATKINHYLIIYQPRWDGIDNYRYFSSRFLDGMFFEDDMYTNHWYCVK